MQLIGLVRNILPEGFTRSFIVLTDDRQIFFWVYFNVISKKGEVGPNRST
jgi:hypothetical protein